MFIHQYSVYQGHIVITQYINQHFLSIEVILDKESITDEDSFIRIKHNFDRTSRKILDDHLYREEQKSNKCVFEFYASQTEMGDWYIRKSLDRIAEALEYANIEIDPEVILCEIYTSTH